MRILAIAAEARSPLYRNVQTYRENGVDLVIGSFHGAFVPRGTPPEIVARLADALEKTMASAEVNKQMQAAGAGVMFLKGRPAADFLARQDATYKSLIVKLGLMVAPSR